MEVGHLQAKFTGHFSPALFHLWLLGVSRRRLVAKVGKNLNYRRYNSGFLCLGGVAARNWWRKLERAIQGIVQ
jgi:hypothetical protein